LQIGIHIIAAAIGASLVAGTATANDAIHRLAATVEPAQVCGTLGPYAARRDANDVVDATRGMGYRTQIFQDEDGYYVRVC
jgi:hypothetical protein